MMPTEITAATGPPERASRREEARLDKIAAAEIQIKRDAEKARLQMEQDRAWAEERRKDREARDRRRAEARKRHADQRDALGRWVKKHTTDLLFVPVIGVPAALSWTSMAEFGQSVWPGPGVLLPLLSEFAMWAFALSTTARQRENERAAAGGRPHDVRPVWHLQAGTAVFAAFGGALNFLHGLSDGTGTHAIVIAVSMALVSVSGVIAHQLVTAGPRASKAEKDAARMEREAARRQLAVRRRAVRDALVDLDEDGRATLVYEAGTVRLSRSLRGLGRARLVREDRPLDRLPDLPPAPAPPGVPPVPPGDTRAEAGSARPGGRDEDPFYEPATGRVRDIATARHPHRPRAGSGGNVPLFPADEDPGDGTGETPLGHLSRHEVISLIAEQIRKSESSGTPYKPDYRQLIADTGRSQSNLEKLVRAARRSIAETGTARPHVPGRAGEDPPGEPA